MFACPATEDFFRLRIDQMIDLRHPLAVLASRMPWQQVEASVANLFVRKARADVLIPRSGSVWREGHARRDWQQGWAPSGAPARDDLFAFFLKHAFNESDKGVVAR
ncbi:MAG: hypothetical protein ACH34Y_04480 [Brachymonas sp.]